MKKLLLLPLLLLLSLSAHAQYQTFEGEALPGTMSYTNSPFGLSLKGGVLFSLIDRLPQVQSDPISPTFTGELTVYYKFNNNISVSTGFGYNKVGAKTKSEYEMPPTHFRIDGEIEYSYLYIPLFASYKFNINRFYIGADAGISFNINTQAKYKSKISDDNGYLEEYESDYDDNESFVPSILIGLKAGYKINNRFSVDITGRYNPSLKNARETELRLPDQTVIKTKEKYSSIALMLGVNYNF